MGHHEHAPPRIIRDNIDYNKNPCLSEKGSIVKMDANKEYSIDPSIAIKHDQGKLRWGLLPLDALEEVVKVLTFGAIKYGDRNWEKGFDFNRNLDALHRHIVEWSRGHDTDSESGFNHLSHAICNLLFLLTFQLRGVGNDDRSKY